MDRDNKRREYAEVPSLRCYVILEQVSIAATFYQRQPGGGWTETTVTGGSLILPGLDIELPLAGLYRRSTFTPAAP